MPGKTLRILCFGDSLTSGWHAFGTGSQPYSQVLTKRLHEAFPDLDKIDVVTNGVPGDMVMSARWMTRLEKAVERSNYDWVLILGGTNDLPGAVEAVDIASMLYEVWSYVLSRKASVLAMTVPEAKMRVSWLDQKRAMLNHMILTHTESGYHPFDLKEQIPYHSLPIEKRREYWDDGLHLKAAGYDWMGEKIADALIPLIKKDRRISQTKPLVTPYIPPRISGDDRPLEEEIGDPRDIESGYVVVRKRDLE